MESAAKDIHQVLGNLRRRIDELSKGDYSKGYRNELPKIEANIHHFPPDTIIKFLSPLVQQLNDISEDVYQKLSDDPHEEINQLVDQGIEVDDIQFRNTTGESKRDLMRKEVSSYIYKLNNYIRKYSKSYPSKKVMKYLIYDKDSGKQNLLNLHNALRDFIAEILPDDFIILFAGEIEEINVPINWIGNQAELSHFLSGLFEHNNIVGYQGGKNIDWKIVSNCFRHKGKLLDTEQVQHNTHYPSQAGRLDRILENL